MNTKRETHIRHHHRAPPPSCATERSKCRIIRRRARDGDDDERAMTRRGPSVDDELGELRVREANVMKRKIRRATMRSHGIV